MTFFKDMECVKWTYNVEKIEKKTPLFLAVENNDLKICRDILSNNDIDVNLRSTIVIKDNNDYDAVRKISITLKMQIEKVESSVDKKIQDEEEEQQQQGDEIIKKIEQRTPLHLAVNNEDIEIIQLLLNNQNIDINSKDEKGSTPIEYTKNEKIIKILSQ